MSERFVRGQAYVLLSHLSRHLDFQQPGTFSLDVLRQFFWLQNLRIRAIADQPAFDLPQVCDLHGEIGTSIGVLFDFLTRVPGALLDEWRLVG